MEREVQLEKDIAGHKGAPGGLGLARLFEEPPMDLIDKSSLMFWSVLFSFSLIERLRF